MKSCPRKDSIPNPEHLSPKVEFALRLRLNGVPLEAEPLHETMDILDAAVYEVSSMAYQAKCFAAEVQKKMREIQKSFVEAPGAKATIAERLYKADTDHMALEATLATLKAFADYCEVVQGILTNKYYGLSRQLKNIPV